MNRSTAQSQVIFHADHVPEASKPKETKTPVALQKADLLWTGPNVKLTSGKIMYHNALNMSLIMRSMIRLMTGGQ